MIARLSFAASALLTLLTTVCAIPTNYELRNSTLKTREVLQVLTQDLGYYAPYVNYARAAYCPAENIFTWSCGEACQQLGPVVPIRAAGNGREIPQYYVAYNAPQQELVIAYSGSTITSLASLSVPSDIILTDITNDKVGAFGWAYTNPPIIPENVKIHSGYLRAHAGTAWEVYNDLSAAFQQGGLQYNNNGATAWGPIQHITVVGYSTGAAIAVLESVWLHAYLGPLANKYSWKVVAVGLPLMGNQDFTDYLQNLPIEFVRIANKADPVGRVKFPSYAYLPQKLFHVADSNDWYVCTGGDSFEGPEPYCRSGGSLSSIKPSSWADHWWVGTIPMTNACGNNPGGPPTF